MSMIKTVNNKYDRLSPGSKLAVDAGAFILPAVALPWWGAVACWGAIIYSRYKYAKRSSHR